jgi:hypothetical protein
MSEQHAGAAPAPRVRRAGLAPFLLSSLGGLVLAAGGSADWAREEQVRDVAGVPLTEVVTTSGTQVAPELLAIGIAALLLGLVLLLVRGVGRRWLGAIVLVIGVGAAVAVGLGTLEAAGLPGRMAEGPPIAAFGALMVAAGGLAAARTPAARPRLSARYSIEGDETGDEADDWHTASVEPEDE